MSSIRIYYENNYPYSQISISFPKFKFYLYDCRIVKPHNLIDTIQDFILEPEKASFCLYFLCENTLEDDCYIELSLGKFSLTADNFEYEIECSDITQEFILDVLKHLDSDGLDTPLSNDIYLSFPRQDDTHKHE